MKHELATSAKQILLSNDRNGYTVPTDGLYPYQWNWDSVFVALGFAQFDRNRAWREIEILFESQWDNGMQPHIIFHQVDPNYFPGPSVWQTNQPNKHTSGITQPPVAASIVRQLWESGEASEQARMEALYPKLMAWHDWFATYRDPMDNGLVMTTHPWETGRDNSPEWDLPMSGVDTSQVGEYSRRDLNQVDQSMRPTHEQYDQYLAMVFFGRDCGWDQDEIVKNGPFRVLDVGMSLILLRANQDLLAMAQALGFEEDCKKLQARITKTQIGIDFLWNENIGAYCSYDLIAQRSSDSLSNASFLAFYADVGSPLQRQKLTQHLLRIKDTVSYLLPSCDPASEHYNHILYWRGPIWAVVSYMVGLGLIEQGETKLGNQVMLDTMAVIEAGNFYESFSPDTGEGTGGKQFSWSAAIWLPLNAQRDTFTLQDEPKAK